MKLDSHPLVSIVIPCYNHENFVQECIQSVIDQTYENIELIIIDDGSKDNSVEIIKNFFSLTYVENRGAAFGTMMGGRWFFVALTVIVVVAGGIYYSKIYNKNESNRRQQNTLHPRSHRTTGG